jgi:hypothetical protein
MFNGLGEGIGDDKFYALTVRIGIAKAIENKMAEPQAPVELKDALFQWASAVATRIQQPAGATTTPAPAQPLRVGLVLYMPNGTDAIKEWCTSNIAGVDLEVKSSTSAFTAISLKESDIRKVHEKLLARPPQGCTRLVLTEPMAPFQLGLTYEVFCRGFDTVSVLTQDKITSPFIECAGTPPAEIVAYQNGGIKLVFASPEPVFKIVQASPIRAGRTLLMANGGGSIPGAEQRQAKYHCQRCPGVTETDLFDHVNAAFGGDLASCFWWRSPKTKKVSDTHSTSISHVSHSPNSPGTSSWLSVITPSQAPLVVASRPRWESSRQTWSGTRLIADRKEITHKTDTRTATWRSTQPNTPALWKTHSETELKDMFPAAVLCVSRRESWAPPVSSRRGSTTTSDVLSPPPASSSPTQWHPRGPHSAPHTTPRCLRHTPPHETTPQLIRTHEHAAPSLAGWLAAQPQSARDGDVGIPTNSPLHPSPHQTKYTPPLPPCALLLLLLLMLVAAVAGFGSCALPRLSHVFSFSTVGHTASPIIAPSLVLIGSLV